ncbi:MULTISPECIES: hypothetical protein [Hymenobacter]|uniref:Uncharacterized protein n=3 Tax=Hymenobacter TaxID=89966 RepID=A0A7Y7PS34_9BACT|nr:MULTISPECIES: hypothetical protein [Hymenobacter]NVO32842.1 hypothetical protein [Hymenobacter lapidiphilus]NVO85164.1 hypothetical protein [Hymenobacter terrestris]SDX47698.1 hypothetical protein SAMN04488069_101499 [Hymenobacter psychrophilus]
MDFSKLYHPSALNSFQYIAVVGAIMSGGAQLIIHLLDYPRPEGYLYLYWCWLGLYIFGSLLNLFGKPPEGHHHHH